MKRSVESVQSVIFYPYIFSSRTRAPAAFVIQVEGGPKKKDMEIGFH